MLTENPRATPQSHSIQCAFLGLHVQNLFKRQKKKKRFVYLGGDCFCHNPNFLVLILKVCLRWIYEQGVSVIVKSFNKERMKENLEIFDWELSVEDIQKIDQIQQSKGVPGLEFISDEGPYKSVVELWDEEIQF